MCVLGCNKSEIEIFIDSCFLRESLYNLSRFLCLLRSIAVHNGSLCPVSVYLSVRLYVHQIVCPTMSMVIILSHCNRWTCSLSFLVSLIQIIKEKLQKPPKDDILETILYMTAII